MDSFDGYTSPYSWRYGSQELRRIWSERHKRRLWRELWLALAEIQHEYGIVTREQVQDLQANVENIDIPRAFEIEQDLQHDVMAEVRTYAEQCPVGGGIIHLGMTSMDVVDNADALRVKASIQLIASRLQTLAVDLAKRVLDTAAIPVMGYTHLQPAEPTTLGYRLAQYLQDLITCLEQIQALEKNYRGKGLKGAVGTRASFKELFGEADLGQVETAFARRINLDFFPVTTQTYPRLQDYQVLNGLAAIAAVLNKFAYDLRVLQMPALGEWREPRHSKQVGSTAMPFKHNPIQAEKMSALARLAAQLPRVGWDDTAYNLLERTLDDSANRRTILPEAFLILDEMLLTAKNILIGFEFDSIAAKRNLETYALFSAQERVLMALSGAGADRQAMHEVLRRLADQAWQVVREGGGNPLEELMLREPAFQRYLNGEALKVEMQSGQDHIGDAAALAADFARNILTQLKRNNVPAGQELP